MPVATGSGMNGKTGDGDGKTGDSDGVGVRYAGNGLVIGRVYGAGSRTERSASENAGIVGSGPGIAGGICPVVSGYASSNCNSRTDTEGRCSDMMQTGYDVESSRTGSPSSAVVEYSIEEASMRSCRAM